MKHFILPKDGGLKEADLPEGILHSFEKIRTGIYADAIEACEEMAEEIAECISEFEKAGNGRNFKLGFSSDKSLVTLYEELVRLYEGGKISFKNVEVFSMSEFFGNGTEPGLSINRNLREQLLDKVDIAGENVIIPDGTLPAAEVSEYCRNLEKRIGKLDLFVATLREDGQLGFNNAGSAENSRTRTMLLSYDVRKDFVRTFGGKIQNVPGSVITMGVGTIMNSDRVLVYACGETDKNAIKNIAEGDIDPSLTASYLQRHDCVRMYADENSAALLTRVVSPWMIGSCNWTRKFIRKAVVWLCQKVGKPVLKLSQKDYLENSLGELLEKYGEYDKINIDVFNDLQHTITGWPGGKPDADDSFRPVKSAPFPKRVLIFSPHPDDDVISMGGTFIRLVEQGHDVHVAYETSGNVAVHDDVVYQHIDAAYQLGFGDRTEEVRDLIEQNIPGKPEPVKLLELKAAIRRSEARGAVRSFGLNDKTNAHFLNLPFYESGGIEKLPRTQKDIDIIKKLIKQVHPDQIYMAGDLADPHGTHRVCTEAALEAIEQLENEGEDWLLETYIWMYRGAWMEWELGQVDMAVPLSPAEMIKKRHTIFRHLSQKDIVPFPGDDPREFWQRAEERTQNTARLYDELGMAEYQAIEVFLRLR